MCGIAGLWRFGGASEAELAAQSRAMTSAIAYRGPDGDGHWIDAAAGIALINAVGNVGGFVGPYLLGWVLERTQSFAAGLAAIGAILIAGGALVLSARD